MHKLCLVGDSSAGKTSLANRIAFDRFSSTYEPTLGAGFYVKRFSNGNSLAIWDTAGQERYLSIAPMYFRNSLIALLCTDTTDIPSVESVLARYRLEDYVNYIFVVLTKIDIQVLDYQELKKYARLSGFRFAATSSKTGAGVSELMDEIAKICEGSPKPPEVLAEVVPDSCC